MQKIPLDIIDLQGDGYHILVHVNFFDCDFKMVVDTGASKTVVDKNTLLHSGIPKDQLRDTNLLSTGLGTTNMQSFIMDIPELHIGTWKIKHFTTAVLDLSSINYAYMKMGLDPVIGVLGGDILRRFGAHIDYRKLTLTLRDRVLKKQAGC